MNANNGGNAGNANNGNRQQRQQGDNAGRNQNQNRNRNPNQHQNQGRNQNQNQQNRNQNQNRQDQNPNQRGNQNQNQDQNQNWNGDPGSADHFEQLAQLQQQLQQQLVIPDNLTGPFLRERRLAGRFQHEGGARAASVIFYSDGGCDVVTAQGTQRVRQKRWLARVVSVCEVACGRHVTSFEVELPARGAATFFRTKVTLRWQVTDYERVVRNQLRDVEQDLGPEIVWRLQEVSGRYAVSDAHRANEAIRADIDAGRWSDLGAEVGLATTMFIEVGTDQVHIDHVAEARSDQAEADRIARRMPIVRGVAHGSPADQLAHFMASATPEQSRQLILQMREDDAQGRTETRAFFLRMLEQGRITSPELSAHLRALMFPHDPAPDALYAPPSPPPAPRLSARKPPALPGGSSYDAGPGPSRDSWPGDDDREAPAPARAPAPADPGAARVGRVWNDGGWVDEETGSGTGNEYPYDTPPRYEDPQPPSGRRRGRRGGGDYWASGPEDDGGHG